MSSTPLADAMEMTLHKVIRQQPDRAPYILISPKCFDILRNECWIHAWGFDYNHQDLKFYGHPVIITDVIQNWEIVQRCH